MLLPVIAVLMAQAAASGAPETAPDFLVVSPPAGDPLTKDQFIRFTVLRLSGPALLDQGGGPRMPVSSSPGIVQVVQGSKVACTIPIGPVEAPANVPYRGKRYWAIHSALYPSQAPCRLLPGIYRLRAVSGTLVSSPSDEFSVGPSATAP